MILEVLKYPHKTLDSATTDVSVVDEALLNKINDMIDTMYANNGCGLAANQVGFNESVLVFDCTEDADEPSCMINPKIISEKGLSINQEGCLSFPDIGINVARPDTVTVEFLDINGKAIKKTFSGPEAICIHHEIDHLLGKTFLSRTNRRVRRAALSALRRTR